MEVSKEKEVSILLTVAKNHLNLPLLRGVFHALPLSCYFYCINHIIIIRKREKEREKLKNREMRETDHAENALNFYSNGESLRIVLSISPLSLQVRGLAVLK
jgi:hypothetical protein